MAINRFHLFSRRGRKRRGRGAGQIMVSKVNQELERHLKKG
jgi:hypothetical protein